jgi:hypothetical protein
MRPYLRWYINTAEILHTAGKNGSCPFCEDSKRHKDDSEYPGHVVGSLEAWIVDSLNMKELIAACDVPAGMDSKKALKAIRTREQQKARKSGSSGG